MSKLTTADMKLIDSLFGMYGGHVMDFSNNRFDSLFKRDIGVNIYDDAYAIHGTSKGKRLWVSLRSRRLQRLSRRCTSSGNTARLPG